MCSYSSPFFLESDEGTETILPGHTIQQSMQLFYDTSLYGKYLIYAAAFRRLPIPMHPASRSGNIRPLIPEYPAK